MLSWKVWSRWNTQHKLTPVVITLFLQRGILLNPRNSLSLPVKNPSIWLKDSQCPYFSNHGWHLPLYELYVNGIKWHIFCSMKFILFTITTMRAFYVLGLIVVWLFSLLLQISLSNIPHSLFRYFRWTFGYLQFRAIIHIATMIILCIFFMHKYPSTFLLDTFLVIKWTSPRELQFNLSICFQIVFWEYFKSSRYLQWFLKEKWLF